MTDWQVGQLRLTIFPKPEFIFGQEDWWEAIFNSHPDNRTIKQKGTVQIDESLYGSGAIRLEVTPLRIDLKYIAKFDKEDIKTIPPILGEYKSVIQNYLEIISRWFTIESIPDAVRIAYGASLYSPASTKQEGYKKLDEYLSSVSIDPKGSSDFLYQINRSRETTLDIPGLILNRLSKWSVLEARLVVQAITQADEKIEYRSEGEYNIHLELDINTSQHYKGTLNRDEMSEIFSELVDLGYEISQNGDIP